MARACNIFLNPKIQKTGQQNKPPLTWADVGSFENSPISLTHSKALSHPVQLIRHAPVLNEAAFGASRGTGCEHT